MSLVQIKTRLAAINPRVWTDGARLMARTALVLRLCCLFAYDRRVCVDTAARRITIERVLLWLLPWRTEIPFDRVEYITYRFGRLVTGWDLWVGTTDQVETFRVGLALQDPRGAVTLLRFRGLGSVMTGWSGVLLGDDSVVDCRGTQEESAWDFLTHLRRLLGVPLGRPIEPVADVRSVYHACAACGRYSPPNKSRCQYCGGELAPAPAPGWVQARAGRS